MSVPAYPRRFWRWLWSLPLLLPALAPANDMLSEDNIKAGFILNFASYADWPAAAIEGGVLRVCGLGGSPLAGNLAKLNGRLIHGREVTVRQDVRPEEWRDCHVLFIPATEAGLIDQVLRTSARTPVLTVSDSPGFVRAGGIIGLKERAGRIRFDINQAAARRAGLGLSSRLLNLADEVVQ
ncbi:MAG: YfiR family protein [Thiobacillus sp.]|nr:YfiR family protein [Thiobacillus sp.]